ncbi:adenylate/guanylate cyclase domain-containing protein [Lewinella sp. IMCC34183]|uniref:adenylate/guanylate cyclase domain-containing protein n=1 Tax=Lewinella sp. IMCC34183 TaxID=2248762 RepID=UPI000E2501DC|nr:adenylate/guanylate cyclase domain-containing protein [Lewinella sp. IMCC34183]
MMPVFPRAAPGTRRTPRHPCRIVLLVFVLTLAPAFARPLYAQSVYAAQVTAIESMIERAQYATARVQSQALIDAGRQQQLADVEAYGHYLYGRTLLEDPGVRAQQRVEGINELLLASAGFSDAGLTQAVDSIAAQLRGVVAEADGPVAQLPLMSTMRQAGGRRADTAEVLEETALSAIVALQNQEIEALTDSQLRQLLHIQQQELALDSFRYHSLNDSLELLQQQFELRQQRSLTNEERQRRNFFIVLALGVMVVLGVLYFRYRSVQQYQLRIKNAQERSDDLLLNILPRAVASELKENGKATARRYESVSVLFTDFVGFSRVAGNRDPEELVRMLDRTFRAFDDITERHGLEKIKTIGDAYMCVGGVPVEDPDHAARTVQAALEIQRYLAESGDFRARAGIHTGPVVAGVVGRKKFAFDIWGDTVNQAARLEQAGAPGEVTISRATCALLDDRFECEQIGTFEAKNIGTLDRYRVRESRLMKKPS